MSLNTQKLLSLLQSATVWKCENKIVFSPVHAGSDLEGRNLVWVAPLEKTVVDGAQVDVKNILKIWIRQISNDLILIGFILIDLILIDFILSNLISIWSQRNLNSTFPNIFDYLLKT
jgi:hypothetical protein